MDIPIPPSTPSGESPSIPQQQQQQQATATADSKKPEARKASDEGLRGRINVSDVSTIKGVDPAKIRAASSTPDIVSTPPPESDDAVPKFGVETDKEDSLGKVNIPAEWNFRPGLPTCLMLERPVLPIHA